MSIKGSVQAECPSCNEKFDAEYWSLVRGDQDAELKEAVLSGELDLLMCPGCSHVFPCEESFIYMDPGKELLVFIMPDSYAAEKEKWLAKMAQDFEGVKQAFIKEISWTDAPHYYFGSGALIELLSGDRDREEETEVLEFMAGEKGYKLAPVRPSFARNKDLPFSFPYEGKLPDKNAALSAATALYSANDALGRLKNLISELEALKGHEIPFMPVKKS